MKSIGYCMLALLIVTTAVGQKSKTTAAAAPKAEVEKFKGLKWRNIGPFRGGRANAIAGDPINSSVYYVGYTGGGIAKTDDGGMTWRNISDGFFKVGSIGDIAVCESDANVIYAGSGEHAVRGVMTSYGDGVYKSTDGGATWKNVGLEKTRHISDVLVHPHNADVVFVAAQGPVHGPSPDRGVFKSTDGGTTWKKTLYVDENTGAVSLSMDMNNPRVLYAAMWQHRRYPWKVESGGAGCGLWKSVDGGETWSKINEGLPKEMGKIGVSVSRANSSRVFAIVEAEKSKAGVYRSDDGGKKWTLQTNDQTLTARSWYYMEIFADPVNADVVYVLNAPMMRSIDGGKTFANVRVGHGDTHDLWINPKNNQNLALADDGGGEITYNTGRTWSPINNQATAQFYRVNTDNRFPYWVYGGQQDNNSVATPSRNGGFGITEKDWFNGPGCESAYVAFNDPGNPELLYGGCYQGQIDVLDTRTGEAKDLQEYPATNLAFAPKKMKYRFNWNAPLINSPHNPKVMYHAANVLFKTSNGGLNWEIISPDLTRNDSTRQESGGGPITNEGAGGENYNTIYYVIESPHEAGTIYTGSDCGLVHITRDGGKSWQNITPKDWSEGLIHSIEVSPHDKGTVYLSGSRYKFNDFANYTFKSTDYGKTWMKIGAGVGADDFIKVIREDKKVKDVLYAGSERSFYISFNGGGQWHKLQLNLPVVPVTDLIIRDNDLVAATAGRSFWILDDLGAIQQSKGVWGDATARIFTPKPTYRLSSATIPAYLGDIPGLGKNPLNGVILDYYLGEKADTAKVTLQIFDRAGKLIRSYTNLKDESIKSWPGGPPAAQQIPAEAGVNRFAWDFRTEALTGVNGVFVYGDHGGYRVAPGTYKARLTFKKQVSETELELLADPKVVATTADWAAQQDYLQRLSDQFNEVHKSVNQMRQVKKHIETINESLKARPENNDLIELGKKLSKKIEQWEMNLIEPRSKNFQDVINFPNRLNAEFLHLRSVADTHDPRLTQGAKDRARDVETQWQGYKSRLADLVQKDIAEYNKIFRDKNLPALMTEGKPAEINN